MGIIGSPIDTSLLQAAQAQQVASKAKDSERAARDASARRFKDMVELRVAGVEAIEAIRKLPANESEQAEEEHRAHDDDAGGQRVDVQA
jgi:hypothetical protein